MSLEEFEENITPRQKKYVTMKSIMDYAFGVFYIGMGILFLFAEKFNLKLEVTESPIMKIFAGLMIVYGLFRIYRGYKKKYLIERP
ncbi:MAG: hypothetical protein ABIQ56_05955 [Chitinophagaceae bacterium]